MSLTDIIPLSGPNLVLAIFLLYWGLVSTLNKKGILEKYNISTWGPLPILMIRTTKGLGLLDTLAKPKKYWRYFANLGILLMFVGMASMFLIILISDLAMYTSFLNDAVPEPGKYNAPRNIFLIPGVNEFIPFTWGFIALIVTLVVHEFSHAILCRVENIRVKSMGLLLALVPIGGFAEPDEEELFGKNEDTAEELEEPALTATIEEIEAWEKRKQELELQKEQEQEEESKKEEEKEEKAGTEGEREEEPREKELREEEPRKAATRNQRARILAAGVMANFVVAFIAFALFFGPALGGIAPLSDVMIVNVSEGSPAGLAGLEENMVITRIDETNISNARDLLLFLSEINPGDPLKIQAAKNGEIETYELKAREISKDYLSGFKVRPIDEGPAEAAGLQDGMLMIRIDEKEIRNEVDFVAFMATTKANQTVQIELYPQEGYEGELTENGTVIFEVPLVSNGQNERGFLGVNLGAAGSIQCPTLGMAIGEYPAKAYLDVLKMIPSLLDEPVAWLILFGLPIVGLDGGGFRGFSGTFAQFYQPVGWAEPFGIGVFWLANAMLWIGWLNFYVGLFNCLPAVPLDGGHVFRDYTYSLIYRLTGNENTSIRLSNSIAASFSLLIMLSFVFMIIGPFVGQWLR